MQTNFQANTCMAAETFRKRQSVDTRKGREREIERERDEFKRLVRPTIVRPNRIHTCAKINGWCKSKNQKTNSTWLVVNRKYFQNKRLINIMAIISIC